MGSTHGPGLASSTSQPGVLTYPSMWSFRGTLRGSERVVSSPSIPTAAIVGVWYWWSADALLIGSNPCFALNN